MACRKERTFHPRAYELTHRRGAGRGLGHALKDLIGRMVVRHASFEELVLASLLAQRLEPTSGLPTVVEGGYELPVGDEP